MGKALYFHPGKNGEIVDIENILESGVLESRKPETEMPFVDNVIVIFFPHQKKEINRPLIVEGKPAAFMLSDFYMVGVRNGKMTGLTKEQIQKYMSKHYYPAGIFFHGDGIGVFSYDPEGIVS